VPPGGASDAKVDATGRERFEHTKRFGDFEGAVMRQHNAAGPQANARRFGGQPREQHFR